MSIEEEIIRKYVDDYKIYLRSWGTATHVYIINKSGSLYNFEYQTIDKYNLVRYTWAIPVKYYDRELRKHKLNRLLGIVIL